MANPWIAALVALLTWWASTGVILAVVSRADHSRGHLAVVIAGLPVLALGWTGYLHALGDESVRGAYLGFFASIAIWGWFELAFLCGVLTGPNTWPCPPGVAPWERFLRAWGTIAHSEMALVASMIALAALAWDAPNQVGMWTFAVLFFARVSAKLNVFLGVPNINVEFLPAPVRHLASHFRVAPMNAFFPLSVTLLTFATACWIERALSAEPGSGALIAHVLLAALTALALLEHWLMVLPIPDARLWRWMLGRAPETSRPPLPKTQA